MSHSQQVPHISPVYMALPSTMLPAWQPICHISHITDAICSLYNFCKYNIFHRPEEAMLFFMVKACLHLELFLFFSEPL